MLPDNKRAVLLRLPFRVRSGSEGSTPQCRTRQVTQDIESWSTPHDECIEPMFFRIALRRDDSNAALRGAPANAFTFEKSVLCFENRSKGHDI